MADLTHITDHADQAVSNLLEQDKGKPKINAFVRIHAGRMQHVEDVMWAVYTQRWIDTAVGVQLDTLGAIVGEGRKGRGDDLYRLWIRVRVIINRSNGKVKDILRIVRLLIGPAPGVTYVPQYPAAFTIQISGIPGIGDTVQAVHDILTEVHAGGVRMNIEYTDDDATAFKFHSDATEGVTDLVHGFGNTTGPVNGGLWSGVI